MPASQVSSGGTPRARRVRSTISKPGKLARATPIMTCRVANARRIAGETDPLPAPARRPNVVFRAFQQVHPVVDETHPPGAAQQFGCLARFVLIGSPCREQHNIAALDRRHRPAIATLRQGLAGAFGQILLDPTALEMDANQHRITRGMTPQIHRWQLHFMPNWPPRIPACADANPSISPRPQAALAITVGASQTWPGEECEPLGLLTGRHYKQPPPPFQATPATGGDTPAKAHGGRFEAPRGWARTG